MIISYRVRGGVDGDDDGGGRDGHAPPDSHHDPARRGIQVQVLDGDDDDELPFLRPYRYDGDAYFLLLPLPLSFCVHRLLHHHHRRHHHHHRRHHRHHLCHHGDRHDAHYDDGGDGGGHDIHGPAPNTSKNGWEVYILTFDSIVTILRHTYLPFLRMQTFYKIYIGM